MSSSYGAAPVQLRNPLFNVLERFLWTAVQAFVGSLPATLALTVDDTRAVAFAGLSAAIAAVISAAKGLTAEGVARQAALRAGAGTTAEVRDA